MAGKPDIEYQKNTVFFTFESKDLAITLTFESEIDDLRELKERLIDYLGRSFAKPDNIEVIERDGNEFVVRADYTTSYRAGSSDYDELFFEVVLKDGKYYIDYFDLYH